MVKITFFPNVIAPQGFLPNPQTTFACFQVMSKVSWSLKKCHSGSVQWDCEMCIYPGTCPSPVRKVNWICFGRLLFICKGHTHKRWWPRKATSPKKLCPCVFFFLFVSEIFSLEGNFPTAQFFGDLKTCRKGCGCGTVGHRRFSHQLGGLYWR